MNPNDDRLERLRVAFRRQWGAEPVLCARAPGRVNLIGEHTDYNDGFVLPMAIDRDIWIAFRPREDRTVRLWSLDFGQASAFALDAFAPDANDDEAPFRPGELLEYYDDWEIPYFAEDIFDCDSGGVPHKHAMQGIVVRRFRGA